MKKGVIGACFLTVETSNTSVCSETCNGDAHRCVINMPFVVYPYMGIKPRLALLYTYGVRSRCSFQQTGKFEDLNSEAGNMGLHAFSYRRTRAHEH